MRNLYLYLFIYLSIHLFIYDTILLPPSTSSVRGACCHQQLPKQPWPSKLQALCGWVRDHPQAGTSLCLEPFPYSVYKYIVYQDRAMFLFLVEGLLSNRNNAWANSCLRVSRSTVLLILWLPIPVEYVRNSIATLLRCLLRIILATTDALLLLPIM